MTEQTTTGSNDNAAPLAWRLMVLALADELVPAKHTQLHQVLRHCGKPERRSLLPSVFTRWLEPLGFECILPSGPIVDAPRRDSLATLPLVRLQAE